MQELVVRLKEFSLDQGPEILIAIAILVIGWVVAVLWSLLVRRAFKRTEIDNKIACWIVGEQRAESIEIERWIGRCVFFLIMLFVLVAFFEVLGLTVVTVPLNRFLIQVFDYAPRLIAPVVLLILAGAMALSQMGPANEIITLAFGLLLGAIAVAVAIAFGAGGRDIAAETLDGWRRKIVKEQGLPPCDEAPRSGM